MNHLATLDAAAALPQTLDDAQNLITHLRAQLHALQALALTDPLTGVANRRAFEDRLAAAFAHARRTDKPLAVAVLDLDNFKARNDTFGHAAGDRCLRHLAAQLTAHTRGADTVARIGGEEFAIILPNTRQNAAVDLCQRIANTLRHGCCPDAVLTFSAGVAELDATMLHPATIVDNADRAMYAAKQAGKDRVAVHKPTFRRAIVSIERKA